MPLCQCPEPGYSQFFGTIAGECVYTRAQMIPEILGFMSLVTWVCAGLPQYWSNYRNKQVDAVAPLLFIIRGAGDVSMLIGTVLEGASIPIQAVSAVFIVDDVIMLSQLYYYTHLNRKGSKLPTSLPMTPARSSTRAVAMLAVAFVSTGTLTASMMTGSSLGAASRTLLGRERFCNDFGRSELEQDIGGWFIWIGSTIYFLSRLPQVYKNWKNKHCDGLSLAMFLMFAIANLTYGGQVILKAILAKTDFATFMSRKFNFVIGSCGVLIFDVIIIIQGQLYSQYTK